MTPRARCPPTAPACEANPLHPSIDRPICDRYTGANGSTGQLGRQFGGLVRKRRSAGLREEEQQRGAGQGDAARQGERVSEPDRLRHHPDHLHPGDPAGPRPPPPPPSPTPPPPSSAHPPP